MMKSLRLVALLATAALPSCVSDDHWDLPSSPFDSSDGDGNGNGDNPAGGDLHRAKALFDSGVFPTIQAKCSTNACHAETAVGATLTRFVAGDPARGWQVATNYAVVVGSNHAASTAPVLTLITPGTHKGVTYTSDEATQIAAWLDSEVEIRNAQPPAVPNPVIETLSEATERARTEFVACMTLADFQAANMATAWASTRALNNQECAHCHSTGDEGFIASPDSGGVFTALTTNPALLMMYFSVDLTAGAAPAKMIINQHSQRGVAQGEDPHREHPRYNPTSNQGMTALTQLYYATMARKAAGTCNPPASRTW